jgi:hypothetical protein
MAHQVITFDVPGLHVTIGWVQVHAGIRMHVTTDDWLGASARTRITRMHSALWQFT